MYSAFQVHVMQLNILIRIESKHNQKIVSLVANEFEKEQFAMIKGNLYCFFLKELLIIHSPLSWCCGL